MESEAKPTGQPSRKPTQRSAPKRAVASAPVPQPRPATPEVVMADLPRRLRSPPRPRTAGRTFADRSPRTSNALRATSRVLRARRALACSAGSPTSACGSDSQGGSRRIGACASNCAGAASTGCALRRTRRQFGGELRNDPNHGRPAPTADRNIAQFESHPERCFICVSFRKLRIAAYDPRHSSHGSTPSSGRRFGRRLKRRPPSPAAPLFYWRESE